MTTPADPDRLPDERLTAIRERLRRATICPYAPVKGGTHRWTDAGPLLVACTQCGHIEQTGAHFRDVADLYGEVLRLRELDDEERDWGQRLADLQAEHQRQAAAWDRQRQRLTAQVDAARRHADEIERSGWSGAAQRLRAAVDDAGRSANSDETPTP